MPGGWYLAGYSQNRGAPVDAAYLINGSTDVSQLTSEILIGAMSTGLTFAIDDATNSGVTQLMEFRHTTTGAAAAGIGARIAFGTENSAGTVITAATIDGTLSVVTAGSEVGDMIFNVRSGGSQVERLRLSGATAFATITVNDATTNAVTTILTLTHSTTGTAASGIGTGIDFIAENGGGTNYTGAKINMVLSTVTASSEASYLAFQAATGGSTSEVARFDWASATTKPRLLFNTPTLAGPQIGDSSDATYGYNLFKSGATRTITTMINSVALFRVFGIDNTTATIDINQGQANANVFRVYGGNGQLITTSRDTVSFGSTTPGASDDRQWIFDNTVVTQPNNNTSPLRAMDITPRLQEAAGGTHARVSGVEITALAVTNAGAATTDTVTLYVAGPPTGITPTGNAYAFWVDTGTSRLDGDLQIGNGTVGSPSLQAQADTNTGIYFPAADSLGLVAGGAEIANFRPASTGGGWMIMDEADSNPGTSVLDSLDSLAFYNKSNTLVFAYNYSGTITYLSIPLDGATTTWTHSTTAP